MAKMGLVEKLIVNSKLDYWFHKYFGITKMLRDIEIPAGFKVLEVGAGVGITTEFIARKFPEVDIMATDFDEAQISTAQQNNLHPNVVFQREDATRLTFIDNAFDICFAILVFHHIADFPKALSEIYRVLKPGGKFYIYDIPAKTWNPFHHWFSLGTPGLFSKAEFIQILQDTGFKIARERSKLRFIIECYKI